MNRFLTKIVLLLCLLLPAGLAACSDDDDADDATRMYERIENTYHDKLCIYVGGELFAYGEPDMVKGFRSPYLIVETQGRSIYFNLNYLLSMSLDDKQTEERYTMKLYFNEQACHDPNP